MEVSHNDNPDTHTVIGGGQVRTASIALTKEFIAVLSDNIYTDKRLAVVREIMCNAWDSHIASGITHIPIKVTLSEHKFTVRDMGLGIPDDMIEGIYYKYGASTKVENEEETGGFGLGSKAPFAYTDHFTVTSYNKGTQTTYAMSKGSSDTDGLPDFRTIVSVPTTQSGLEVTVPITSSVDKHQFAEIIEMIAQYGDMLVDFNDTVIDTYSFDNAVDNFLIVPKHDYIKARDSIFVRYGTVIYPIPRDEFYSDELEAVNFKSITGDRSRILVLNAPNNSISVNPSRETLSLSNKTLNTIKGLLVNFNNSINSCNKEQVLKEMLDRFMHLSVKKENDNLFMVHTVKDSTLGYLKKLIEDEEQSEIVSSSMEFCYYEYLNHNSFKEENTPLHIPYNTFNKLLLESILIHIPEEFRKMKLLTSLYKTRRNDEYNTYTNSYVFRRNYIKINNTYLKSILGEYAENLKVTVYNSKKLEIPEYLINSRHSDMPPPKIIILGHSIASIKEYSSMERYCLNISRKKGVAEKVIKILEDNNITIIDQREIIKPKSVSLTPKRPTKKGYTALSFFLENPRNSNVLSDINRVCIEKPDIVFSTSLSFGRRTLDGFSNKEARLINKIFPNAIIVSSSNTEYNVNTKFGLEYSDTLIDNHILSFAEDDNFLLAASLLECYEETYCDLSSLMDIAEYDDEIAKLMEVEKVSVTDKYKDLANIYAFRRCPNYWVSSIFKELDETIKKRVNPNKFLESFQNNPLRNAFDIDNIVRALRREEDGAQDMLTLLKLAII